MNASRALLLAVAAVATALPAAAHQAPAGWEYDLDCCSTRDCAPVRGGAVREVAGGYQVTILPGTHPMVRAGAPAVSAFVAHGDARIRVSGDDARHACVIAGRVLCIYVPPGGV